jgi:hypothetical protein
MKDKTIWDILPSMKDDTLFKIGKLPKTDAIALGVFGTKIQAVIECVGLPNGQEIREVSRHLVVIHDAREKVETEGKMKQQMRAQETMKKQMEFEEDFGDPVIREAFIHFCEKEQTIENVHLLIELEKYRKLDQTSRLKRQKIIYDRYLKEGAKEGLNISNESKTQAIDKCQNGVGQIDLFNLLEKAIKFNLMSESFSRFQIVKIEMIDHVLKELNEKNPHLNISISSGSGHLKGVNFLTKMGGTPTIGTPEPEEDKK